MTNDDPFNISANDGATVIHPIPGGRHAPRSDPHLQSPTPPISPTQAAPSWSGNALPPPMANPLVSCAAGLLTLAGELRRTLAHTDPTGLRDGLVHQMRDFETCARAKGLVDAVVLPARYVLCALIDEAILDTPWGAQSVWTHQGLLISFHNETWGGEKFFSALDRLLAYPSGNINLLELMYLCLALGFEGRYRTRPDGQAQLAQVREQLYQTIRSQRGDHEPDLSPHWRGVDLHRNPLIHQLPLWVFGAVAGLVLLGCFAFYTFSLNNQSDPIFLALSQLDQGLGAIVERPHQPVQAPPASRETPPATPTPPPVTLRILLADEIRAGQLEVLDGPVGQTVMIRGDALFASGSSSILPAFAPLLRRIGEALARLPGQVLVTGHSDSRPIKTLRFPSNWHLSQERAEQVSKALIQVVGDPSRFTAEGRADAEPLVPANPRDPRNRRVEITLKMPIIRTPPSVTADIPGIAGIKP